MLTEYDQGVGDVEELDLVGQLDAAARSREARTPEYLNGALAEVALFYVTRMRDPEPVTWDLCWQPASTMTDKAGEDWHYPAVADVDDEIVGFRRPPDGRRTAPALRTRYADLA